MVLTAMNEWYAALQRPPLTPPDWVFSPVWTVLYLSIAVAIVLYYRSPRKTRVAPTTAILIAHIAANIAWTFLFFGLRSPAAALADIIFMDLSLVAIIVLFRRAGRAAALILVPYLLWILFATYLNIGFLLLN